MKKIAKYLVVIVILLLVIGWGISDKKKIANEANGWNLMLVNEDYYIPEDYEVDLVTMDNGKQVDERIYPFLQEMLDAARKDDIYMVVVEGYRTQSEQQEIMDEKIEEYQEDVLVKFVAEWLAEKWVAVPGTSEHQLGIRDIEMFRHPLTVHQKLNYNIGNVM